MPFDREQPDKFNKGDPLPGAGDLNRLLKGGRRQINGPQVSEYGDRVVVQGAPDSNRVPPNSFFLQKFVVLEVFDDYLKCKVIEYDLDDTVGSPSRGWWEPYVFQAPTIEPEYKTVYVAKPDEIRRSFWDNRTITIDGEGFTYLYLTPSTRQVTSGLTSDTFVEILTAPYYPGDVISAVRGVSSISDPTGGPITWTDANTAGRHWHVKGGGVFILITDASPYQLDVSRSGPCPISSGTIVIPHDDCSMPGDQDAMVIPLNPGLFKVGYVYRAWPTVSSPDTDSTGSGLTMIYVADPVLTNDCDRGYTGDVVVLKDVAVSCVAGVITTTKTFVTLTFECGLLISVTE